MKKNLLCVAFASLAFSGNVLAEDITGTWKTIDDKTRSSKAILEMRQENNSTYTAKIIKVTPRPGYTPKETCINCPAPYTNKPILGLDVLTGLKAADDYHFVNTKVLDPLTGKIYSGIAKLSANGKHLTLRGYVGVSALGRSQT